MFKNKLIKIYFLILLFSSACYKKNNKAYVKEDVQQPKAGGILLGEIPYPVFSLPFFFNTNHPVIQPNVFQLQLPIAADYTYDVYYTFDLDVQGYPLFPSNQFVSNISFFNGKATLLLPINFLSYGSDKNYPVIFISMRNVQNSNIIQDLYLNFEKSIEFTSVSGFTGYLNHQTNFTPSFFNTPIQLFLEPNPNLLPIKIAEGKVWNLAMKISIETKTGDTYSYEPTGSTLEAMQNISLNNNGLSLNTILIPISLGSTQNTHRIIFDMYWYYVGAASLSPDMNTTIAVKSIVLFSF